MQVIPELITPLFLALAMLVAVCAGFVKGTVGFAMPMLMISGLSAFLAPEIALAALIIPTVLANGWQGLRGGVLAAWRSVLRFRVYIVILLISIALSAQFARSIPPGRFFLLLGIPVTFFAIVQLFGLRVRICPQFRRLAEVVIGAIAGGVGGISGVWGPPTVAYLAAVDTAKAEQVRVQGVVYGAGAVVLLMSHLKSGVLNMQTVPLSLWLVVPAMIGMGIGLRVQDRLDQEKFRRATLAVLILAGLNLIRRGMLE